MPIGIIGIIRFATPLPAFHGNPGTTAAGRSRFLFERHRRFGHRFRSVGGQPSSASRMGGLTTLPSDCFYRSLSCSCARTARAVAGARSSRKSGVPGSHRRRQPVPYWRRGSPVPAAVDASDRLRHDALSIRHDHLRVGFGAMSMKLVTKWSTGKPVSAIRSCMAPFVAAIFVAVNGLLHAGNALLADDPVVPRGWFFPFAVLSPEQTLWPMRIFPMNRRKPGHANQFSRPADFDRAWVLRLAGGILESSTKLHGGPLHYRISHRPSLSLPRFPGLLACHSGVCSLTRVQRFQVTGR